jgi:signal transduction histidine kinase
MQAKDAISEHRNRIMRSSGLLIWLFLGLPALDPSTRRAQEIPAHWVAWIACYIIFGVAYYFGSTNRPLSPIFRINAFILQSLCVLGMIFSFQNYFMGFLMVLIAKQLGFFLPSRVAVLWIAVQTAVAIILLEPHWHMGWRWAVTGSLIGLEAFAVAAGILLAKEVAAREELLLLNIELTSTRELLKETSRAEERLHIARELHDVLGHHLAALSIQLEHAVHIAPAPVRADIENAQASTRQMLGEVRSVVGSMRSSEQVDLAPILDSLAKRVLRPKISLEIPTHFAVADGARAHAVLRCVQEIITNTVKHSGAENLWITVCFVDGTIEVSARDDGRTLAPARPGGGLTGMKERFESLGGRVEFKSQPDTGFALRAYLPAHPQDKFV